VKFEYGDSTLPWAVSRRSSQTVSIALAVQQASEKLLTELLSFAQQDSNSVLKDAKALMYAWRTKASFARSSHPRRNLRRDSEARKKGLCGGRAQDRSAAGTLKYSMHSYAAQFCEVRVHEQTGEVRISRWVGAFDVGRILNPKTALSQFRGGIIMGIGMALTEETMFDDRPDASLMGRLLNITYLCRRTCHTSTSCTRIF